MLSHYTRAVDTEKTITKTESTTPASYDKIYKMKHPLLGFPSFLKTGRLERREKIVNSV